MVSHKKDKKQIISHRTYDHAGDLALLANKSAQAEFLLYTLDQVERGIGLCVKTDEIEFICFKQEGIIST